MSLKILGIFGGGIGNIIQATPAWQAILKEGHSLDLMLHCNSSTDFDIFKLPGIGDIYDVRHNPSKEYDFQINGPFTPGAKYRAKKYLRSRNYARHYPESSVYFELVASMGIKVKKPDAKILVKDTGQKVDRDTVAIYPGSKHDWAMKRWDKYDELASHFKKVLLVGSKLDIDSHGKPTWIKREWNWPKNVERFHGTLMESAWVISQCKMFIGNDGGLAHVAAATGIPTYVLFGPSSVVKNKPFNKNAKAISYNIVNEKKLDCQPCQFRKEHWFDGGKIGCPFNMKCMAELTVKDVLRFINDIQ